MKLRVLITILLGACAGNPVLQLPGVICETHCGMRLRGLSTPDGGMPQGWTCPLFQQAEDWSLFLLSKHGKDPRVVNGCSNVNGWSMWVHSTPAWFDTINRNVAGETYCDSLSFEVGYTHLPMQGSMTHELGHVLQRCAARPPVDDDEDSSHAGWHRDGIYDAAQESNDWRWE